MPHISGSGSGNHAPLCNTASNRSSCTESASSGARLPVSPRGAELAGRLLGNHAVEDQLHPVCPPQVQVVADNLPEKLTSQQRPVEDLCQARTSICQIDSAPVSSKPPDLATVAAAVSASAISGTPHRCLPVPGQRRSDAAFPARHTTGNRRRKRCVVLRRSAANRSGGQSARGEAVAGIAALYQQWGSDLRATRRPRRAESW